MLVVFPLIFVVDTKILYGYNFVALITIYIKVFHAIFSTCNNDIHLEKDLVVGVSNYIGGHLNFTCYI